LHSKLHELRCCVFCSLLMVAPGASYNSERYSSRVNSI